MSQTYTITSGNCCAVISEHGAELRSFRKEGREYMWQADPAFWGRTSPVLFPFVGSPAGKEYRYEGVTYAMGQHGFARDMDFEVLEKEENRILFLLQSDEETYAKYPFAFALKIEYVLQGSALTVRWMVENDDLKDLHFSIGAHPAFNCHLEESCLHFSARGKSVQTLKSSVVSGGLVAKETIAVEAPDGTLKLQPDTFDAIDTLILENRQVDCVELETPEGSVKVRFDAPLVGIWSPPGKNAPFLCIEPWYGRADGVGFAGELAEREWGNTLAPGEIFDVSYCVEI